MVYAGWDLCDSWHGTGKPQRPTDSAFTTAGPALLACAPQARQEAILATKKLSEARAAVKEESEGRIRAERAHEEDARQWDTAAQSLRGTIQELHDKYAPPRDLDRLRAELQQELEAPHAERVASLEAELDATRDLLSAARRRFEALKVRIAPVGARASTWTREVVTTQSSTAAGLTDQRLERGGHPPPESLPPTSGCTPVSNATHEKRD